ncbi:hypothetical protein HMPREF9441_01096 [Paraprevotella clara YIT 11840]|uniref:Uncharacterized protein n=1 Tax=Paraprevotella clara YIT 11840 TaxID=762968 RepID=G5SNT4_9BACT|nr:hypothetical protein HMPREF9441_01096 [Paraprevotella clara YIT 11840]
MYLHYDSIQKTYLSFVFAKKMVRGSIYERPLSLGGKRPFVSSDGSCPS